MHMLQVSPDFFTILFIVLVLVDAWAYYQGTWIPNQPLLVQSIIRNLTAGLPYLFACLALLLRHTSVRIYALLLALTAWTLVLVNYTETKYSESSYHDEHEANAVLRGGIPDIAYYIAKPLAQVSLFVVPYLYVDIV